MQLKLQVLYRIDQIWPRMISFGFQKSWNTFADAVWVEYGIKWYREEYIEQDDKNRFFKSVQKILCSENVLWNGEANFEKLNICEFFLKGNILSQ